MNLIISIFLKFEYLLEEDYQISMNADYYAKKLNITYQYLNQLYKEIINQSTKQLIESFVILEVKKRLIKSSIKSCELAYTMARRINKLCKILQKAHYF